MDKKQKTLLGLLAVLVIGAGGVWFVFNSGGSGSSVAAKTGPHVKKQREVRKADSKGKGGKKTRARATHKKKEVKQRDILQRKKAKKKTRRRGRKGKEKKKKILPAA